MDRDLLMDFLFPRHCPVCDDVVTPFGQKICDDCRDKIKLNLPPFCLKCGKKLHSTDKLCKDCRGKNTKYIRGRSLYEYKTSFEGIFKMKYKGRAEFGDYYGQQMAVYLKGFIDEVKPDAIIPVPLHKTRENKRGYNQAFCIAKALGRANGIPVYKNYVKRIKPTLPLKMMTPAERQNNLKKAFIIDQNVVKLKTIIVVDDIYTTGSTIDGISSTLLKNGTTKVYFMTVSCAGEG